MTSDLYREVILDYYRNPRNYGEVENPDIDVKDSNPLCGDVVKIQIKLSGDNRVEDIKFSGEGCAISQASASMLTEIVMGKTLEEIKKIDKKDILKALGTPELGPARIKCALLPLKALKLGLYEYLAKTGEKVDRPEDLEDL